jgi:hypothetical protein
MVSHVPDNSMKRDMQTLSKGADTQKREKLKYENKDTVELEGMLLPCDSNRNVTAVWQ